MVIFIIILAIATPFVQDKIKGLDYYSYFVAKPAIKYEFIDKNSTDSDSANFIYTPVISSYTGLSLGTKFIDATIVFQNEEENDLKESQLLDIQLRGIYNRILWDLYYQNYQGLYLADKDETINDQLVQANAYSYGLGFKYFINKDYKLKHSLGNYKRLKEKQKAWSWLWGLYYNNSQISSVEDNLIPPSESDQFDQINGINEYASQNLGIEWGISGMYTFGSFHSSGLITLSYSYQEQELNGLEITDRQTNASGAYFLFDLGHNWENSTLGLNFSNQTITSPIQNTELKQSRSYSKLYFKYFF